MISMLLKGFIIGIFVSAPVGPIGLLCMQRTLNRGRAHGFATALGATSSDLIYAIIAVFSMSFIIDFIEEYHFVLQIIGSIIVFLFGLYTYLSNPVKKLTKFNLEKKNHVQDFLTSFGLTITNPLVIFLFIALFARFSFVTENTTFWQNIVGICFILLGAFFWWVLLVSSVNFFRNRFNPRRLYVVNQSTGVIFMALAVVSLGYTLFG
jgi:threonine/homoserine/homoserine lactone efflux protein